MPWHLDPRSERSAKTYTSFHGVEPITETEVRRDLLLYDIKVKNPPELENRAPATPSVAAASVKSSS